MPEHTGNLADHKGDCVLLQCQRKPVEVFPESQAFSYCMQWSVQKETGGWGKFSLQKCQKAHDEVYATTAIGLREHRLLVTEQHRRSLLEPQDLLEDQRRTAVLDIPLQTFSTLGPILSRANLRVNNQGKEDNDITGLIAVNNDTASV